MFSPIDRVLLGVSRGRLKLTMRQPVLLLHTLGARTGNPRATPLVYTPATDGGWVVVASNAGAAHHPAWYHNLRAHPEALAVQVGGRRIAVRAHVIDGAERTELWRRVNDNYAGYETYQRRARGRHLPVVLLRPVVDGGRDGAERPGCD